MFTCSKRYDNLPAAHRQHNHDGHCAWIHGHNWSFEIEFLAEELDENGFVVDFGKLKNVKAWLEDHFDHTLLLNEDDPQRKYLTDGLCNPENLPGYDEDAPAVEAFPFAKIVTVPNCGAEKLAEFVAQGVGRLIPERVLVLRVTCYEDNKNTATWRNPIAVKVGNELIRDNC